MLHNTNPQKKYVNWPWTWNDLDLDLKRNSPVIYTFIKYISLKLVFRYSNLFMNYCFLLDVKIPFGLEDINVYDLDLLLTLTFRLHLTIFRKASCKICFKNFRRRNVKINLCSLQIQKNGLPCIKNGRDIVNWKHVPKMGTLGVKGVNIRIVLTVGISLIF